MSNSKGNYPTTPKRSMAAYDKLPPSARVALQTAQFCWAPQPLLTRWRKGRAGYETGADIAKLIERWDRKHHVRDARRGKVAP